MSSPRAGSYEVLARKYRPQAFDGLVGQEAIARTLRSAIEQGKIAHAFLFTGIRGVGKTTAARLLARALNCEHSDKPTPNPCEDPKRKDACSNCGEIAEGRSLDVIEIDGASNRGIDSIRELNENVRYRPAKGRFKVYIIDEAHMVTREGFNALLKTLEEPPPHVKFIFATTAVDKFPDTIVSRCQRYDFRRIPVRKIIDHLAKIAENESIRLSDGAAYVIAREAEGSMRDAESLLDRLTASSAGQEIGDRDVADVLAITDRKTLHDMADAILAGDPKRALEILDAVHEAGRDIERFSRELLEHWRNLVVTGLYGGAPSILSELPEDEIAELRRQTKLRPSGDLQRLFRVALATEEELRGSEYPRLVLEMAVVRMATLEPAVPVDEVLARLDEIQRRAPMQPPRESRPSRPAAPSASDGEVAAAAAAVEAIAVGEQPKGRGWNDFLDFVQTRRISLFFTLSHARVIEQGVGRFVLGVSGEAFRRELESRETTAQVEKLASEFFGGSVEIAIVSVRDEREAAALPPPVEALQNPAVRRAVEILGGEVREVRRR